MTSLKDMQRKIIRQCSEWMGVQMSDEEIERLYAESEKQIKERFPEYVFGKADGDA